MRQTSFLTVMQADRAERPAARTDVHQQACPPRMKDYLMSSVNCQRLYHETDITLKIMVQADGAQGIAARACVHQQARPHHAAGGSSYAQAVQLPAQRSRPGHDLHWRPCKSFCGRFSQRAGCRPGNEASNAATSFIRAGASPAATPRATCELLWLIHTPCAHLAAGRS